LFLLYIYSVRLVALSAVDTACPENFCCHAVLVHRVDTVARLNKLLSHANKLEVGGFGEQIGLHF